MPTSVPRIQVTPACQSHADLLNYWSVLEGRSISSLCSALLEDAVVNAIKDGRAHPVAVQMMNAVIDLRKEELDLKFGGDLRKVKKDNEFQKAKTFLDQAAEDEEGGANDTFVRQFKDSSEADSYWKEVGKQEAEQKNEYNHRVSVIKQAVGLMECEEEKYAKKALLILLRNYSDLSLNVITTKLFDLVAVFNELDLNANEKIQYLITSEDEWRDYLTGQLMFHPGPDAISKEQLREWYEKNKQY